MMKLRGALFSCSLVLTLWCGMPATIFAQRTDIYENDIRYYNRALELFNKEKYGDAQKHFLLYTRISTDRETRINAEYYAGVCAMELFNPDAINMLNGVVLKYPEHSKAQPALFNLGKYFYRAKDNKAALKYLNRINDVALTPADAAEFWFIKGYCHFKTEQFDESKLAFKHIKDEQGKYYDASNYYYGYVAYRQGNHDEAMEHFKRIQKSRTFGPLSQVYIAQIYFSRKQYSEVIAFGDTIANKEIIYDVAGIVGQSYYELGEYKKALPYLERFNSNPPVSKTNKDIYRLGYCYLIAGSHDKAIEQLGSIAGEKDTLAQYSSFNLAQAYLKSDKKQQARKAFDVSYKLGFNRDLTELSLFNYAKLSFELSYQQDALKDLVKFVNEYPESPYIDEARSSLGELLLSTKNYKDAIKTLESIKNPTRDNNMAYQRVSYYRAEELYLNNDYINSEIYFDKSIQFDFDKRLFALSHFWLGELQYKKGNYAKAHEYYQKFQQFPETKETRFYAMAMYNKGYAQLKQDNYLNAIDEFKKFTETDYAKNNVEIYTDAMMRIADCYFVLRNYAKALESYEVIVLKKLNGADYALYQQAMIYGVENKFPQKINSLNTLITNYKKSPYIDDALYEIANVNLQTENYLEALQGFQNIIDNYPRSMYIRKAMLNKGLSYYNQSKDEQALEAFKVLITNYSTSDEAREALVVVKNIFVNKGESEEYLEFVKVLPNVTLSPTYQDSVTYESAFNAYKNGACEKAVKGFGTYITKFGGGFFILKANYYKAECDFKLKNYDAALTGYEYAATYNRNDFTERSTRQTAVLYFMKKNYEKAFEYYSSLERIASTRDNIGIALLGQMKAAALLNKGDTIAQISFKYINSAVTQKEGLIEAHLYIARYYMKQNMTDSAFAEYQYVLKETKNAMAAEAKYNMAYIQSQKKDLKKSKKTIFELADNYSAYEYWVAKGYILLSDIYVIEKDLFQAKATLQSIIENYEGADLKQVAIDKMKSIIDEEDRVKKQQTPPGDREVQPN
ncbi:MAG: tetratricopeptide repeat protein [Bacteroidota bacterium]